MVAAARGLLVLEGIDPVSNEEVLKSFKEKTVASGIVGSETLAGYESQTRRLHQGNPTAAIGREYVEAARQLIEECRNAFQRMDAKLRIQGDSDGHPAAAGPPQEQAVSAGPTARMDLRGVKCPMNYVKAKLKLETMEVGETLELLIDPGEAYENVPRSLRDDGQSIREDEHLDPHYRLLIEKKV